MGFGQLSETARARVLLELKGAAQYVRELGKAAIATERLALATKEQGDAAAITSKKNFILSQSIYTLRRYTFFGTLALVGMGIAAVKMGFQYDSAVQTARVALTNLLGDQQKATDAVKQMYLYAAITPFEFTDVILATRRLMPGFNNDLTATRSLLSDVGNLLARAGVATGPALQRATLAFAHMMNVGHVTGRFLQQLAQDNIPLYEILGKQFRVTGDQLAHMVRRGQISSADAVRAINDYVRQTPHLSRMAIDQTTKTFAGAWTTFRDIVSASFGNAESGIFARATKALRTTIMYINKNFFNTGKPLTITGLVTALDQGLTPSTHRLLHAFDLFVTALRDLRYWLNVDLKILNALAWPVKMITGLFGDGASSAVVWGHALGFLINLLIIEKAVTLIAAIATDIYNLRKKASVFWTAMQTRATKIYTFWKTLEDKAVIRGSWYMRKDTEAKFANMSVTARLTRATKTGILFLWAQTKALWAGTLAWWRLVAATYAEAGALQAIKVAIFSIPIVGWILLAITLLVTLFIKWQWFHNQVMHLLRIMGTAIHDWLITPLEHVGQLMEHLGDKLPVLGKHRTIRHLIEGAVGLPQFAAGGVMAASGFAVVGESGPEIVYLPGGSQVTPHREVAPVVSAAAATGGVASPVIVQLVLRDKVIEEVVVDMIAKRNARR